MDVKELTTKDFLAHLRRHPMPELMDDECLAALANVEAQYGDAVTHGAGLEVRLGEEARYVDYIMNIDTDEVPGVQSLWHEIDYAEFLKGGHIEPCLFANTATEEKSAEASAKFWDGILPPFLGEKRAKTLRAPLDRLLAALPEGARIKQIGTMTSRGELDIMRLVILFPAWETVADGLAAIGWKGDGAALDAAMEPWKETKNIAINIDLDARGVLPKIGIEVFSRWRHPTIVDKFLARLEGAGLCLPSKGDALRRWIRIRPDGDPFIQTLISYFKLNCKGGRIAEAKAYLEQSPYLHHHYFDAYERPVRLDMELARGDAALPVGDALARLRECAENRVRRVRLCGGETYEPLARLLAACRESGVRAEVVLAGRVGRARLEKMIAAGADDFLVEVRSPSETDAGMEALSILRALGFASVRAKWFLREGNAAELAEATRRAEALGAKELLVSGMCAGAGDDSPSRGTLAEAANFIRGHEGKETGDGGKAAMRLSADTCFSPLRAYLGGDDPKQNGNRGIARGCEAGRSFLALRADGTLSPCLFLAGAGGTGTLADYWEQSPETQAMRAHEACAGCPYGRRCLPCPVPGKASSCPLLADSRTR